MAVIQRDDLATRTHRGCQVDAPVAIGKSIGPQDSIEYLSNQFDPAKHGRRDDICSFDIQLRAMAKELVLWPVIGVVSSTNEIRQALRNWVKRGHWIRSVME